MRGTQAGPGDVQSDEYVPRGTLSLLICTHIYVRYMAVCHGVRWTYSAKGAGGLQQLAGGGANPVVLGEIHPADCATGIEQKFGGAGDVVFAGPGLRVQQVVAFDDRCIRVGEECIGVPALGAEIAGSVRWINADSGHANATRFKFAQVMLNTP